MDNKRLSTTEYLDRLLNKERQRSLKYIEALSRMSVLCNTAIDQVPESSERVRLMQRSNEILHDANDDGLITSMLHKAAEDER